MWRASPRRSASAETVHGGRLDVQEPWHATDPASPRAAYHLGVELSGRSNHSRIVHTSIQSSSRFSTTC